MEDLYNDTTFNVEEFFGPYALDGLAKNIKIVANMHFSYGRCYTMLPKVTTFKPVREFFKFEDTLAQLRHYFSGSNQATSSH